MAETANSFIGSPQRFANFWRRSHDHRHPHSFVAGVAVSDISFLVLGLKPTFWQQITQQLNYQWEKIVSTPIEISIDDKSFEIA
jgi:hypothetical protein